MNNNLDNKLRVKCKECGRVYLVDSTAGSTNLLRHHAKHKNISRQGMLLDHGEYRQVVAKAIIRYNLPFSYVKYEGIREVHSFLNPVVQTISRNTAKADVLKLYLDKKEMLKNELEAILNRICLTSDLWTSIISNGYLRYCTLC